MNNNTIAQLPRQLADQFDERKSNSLAELIKQGNFSWVNRSITQDRFPDLGSTAPFKPVIHHLNKYCSTEEVQEMFKGKEGSTYQFLQYLIDNPKAGLDYPIAHIVSEYVDSDGDRCCLYVSRYGRERSLGLGLGLLEDGWRGGWRFFGAEELGN